MYVRCRAALMTEAEPMVATPAGLFVQEAPAHPDRVGMASLKALWSPADLDDARVVLEQLQRTSYAHGTSTGLNGEATSSHKDGRPLHSNQALTVLQVVPAPLK